MRPKTRYANSDGVFVAYQAFGQGPHNLILDLMVGSGDPFEDRGKRTLKGIEGEWRLYEAVL